MSDMMKPSREPENGPARGAIAWRIAWAWIQTLTGTAVIGCLLASALIFFGAHWSLGVAILSLWMILPLLGWFFSADIVRVITGCKAANPSNPEHMRLIRIVHRLFPKTGLPVKPPVFVSPLKLPNAFATGRSPRHAFIAATEGLLELDLTDDELEAVLAHELAHVRSWDVALNSLLAVMSSLFGIICAAGFPRIFHPTVISSGAPLIDKLSEKVRKGKRRFFLPVGGFLGFVVMMALFYVVSSFTKLVCLFVTRARESAADAMAARWTGKPCALSVALQKIVLYMLTHQTDLRNGIITSGLTALLIVNPLEDPEMDMVADDDGLLASIRRWWRGLGENHPPVKDRLEALDRMSGQSCPRIF